MENKRPTRPRDFVGKITPTSYDTAAKKKLPLLREKIRITTNLLPFCNISAPLVSAMRQFRKRPLVSVFNERTMFTRAGRRNQRTIASLVNRAVWLSYLPSRRYRLFAQFLVSAPESGLPLERVVQPRKLLVEVGSAASLATKKDVTAKKFLVWDT